MKINDAKKDANNVITVERTVDNARERLVELTRAATGDGWVYVKGNFSTMWRPAGFYTARYFSEAEEVNLTGAAQALAEIYPEAARWGYTAVLDYNAVYMCKCTTVVDIAGMHHRWQDPVGGCDFYRTYRREGTPWELASKADELAEIKAETREFEAARRGWIEH